jgi:polyisoprenoid-binding protein YceI
LLGPILALVLAGQIVASHSSATTISKSIKIRTIQSGSVEFLAIGKPSFLKINGSGGKPSGTLTITDGKAEGDFTFELASLDAKNETRTEHMKNKYLEVEKFPTAKLTFKDVDVKSAEEKVSIPAMLTLHGQTKPVTLEAELGGPEKEVAKGTFKMKVTDFGIEKPRYGGIGVDDEITVNINAVLK